MGQLAAHDGQHRRQQDGGAGAVVGAQARLLVALTTNLPFRTGREPTHMGTVSTWAESIRRGPRIVPGNFRTRFPDLAAERRAAVGIVELK